MATQVDIDIAKRRYSSDMAAYTFEQFRVARRQYMLTQQNSEGKDDEHSSSPDDHRDDDDDDEDSGQLTRRRFRGVKSTDYATRAPATVNGVAH